MLIDLNHNSGARYETETSLSAAVNAHIDEALLTRQRLQARRDYLGASRIGEPCARRLAYEYAHTPEDPDKAFSGQTLRIFAAGHTFEDLTIVWMRDAGFDLRTRRRDGGQFGFETAGGRVKPRASRLQMAQRIIRSSGSGGGPECLPVPPRPSTRPAR